MSAIQQPERIARPSLEPLQARTLRTLTGSQVLSGVGVSSGVAVGGLLAAELAGSDVYAGLAQTCLTVGAALLTMPAVRMMLRAGRRWGLLAAYAGALLGAACAVAASALGSVALLLGAMFLLGAGVMGNLQARYAATDLAPAGRRGRALAMVVWATSVGAVLGPNLADPGGRVAEAVGMRPLAGSFLFSIAAFGLAAAIIATRLRPDPLLTARALELAAEGARRSAGGASLVASLRAAGGSAEALLGLVAVAVSHTVMVAVMVMTPVHLGHGGASLRVIGLVVSVHVLGMYAFSPVVGWLSDQVGRVPVIGLGALLQLAACVIAGGAGHDPVPLGIGLFLLGVGWSCGLVAGSTLLTESVPMAVRPGVQGASDLVMGLSASLGGLFAGIVVEALGYGLLNVAAAVMLAPVGVLLVSRLARRAGATGLR